MLLTISLLFLSNDALTKSAPRAKPRVSSVFSIHVCQRGVQDCNKAKTGTRMDHLSPANTVAADTSGTGVLKLLLPSTLLDRGLLSKCDVMLLKDNRVHLTPHPGKTGEKYLFGPNETF